MRYTSWLNMRVRNLIFFTIGAFLMFTSQVLTSFIHYQPLHTSDYLLLFLALFGMFLICRDLRIHRLTLQPCKEQELKMQMDVLEQKLKISISNSLELLDIIHELKDGEHGDQQ